MKVRLSILVILVASLALLLLPGRISVATPDQLERAKTMPRVQVGEVVVHRAPSSPAQNQTTMTQPSATLTVTPVPPTATPEPTATPPPTATPRPTETPRPPCDRGDPNSVCQATITVFVFIDRVHRGGCDGNYDEEDLPLPGARITFWRPDGGVEQRITGRSGYLIFSRNINFLPGDEARLEAQVPPYYRGYWVVPCPNSPQTRHITRETFGASRSTRVEFRAKLLVPTRTPTPTITLTPTNTPLHTATPTHTPTPTPTSTTTPVPTGTPTNTPTRTPTPTSTETVPQRYLYLPLLLKEASVPLNLATGLDGHGVVGNGPFLPQLFTEVFN